jgi:hypothetical protein
LSANAGSRINRHAGIQLNERVSLRLSANAISQPAPDIAPSGPSVAKSSGDHTPLGGFVLQRACPMIVDNDDRTITDLNPQPSWAQAWHMWTVFFPRRSITGRLVYGKVWRRHDGLRWRYKKFTEFNVDREH